MTIRDRGHFGNQSKVPQILKSRLVNTLYTPHLEKITGQNWQKYSVLSAKQRKENKKTKKQKKEEREMRGTRREKGRHSQRSMKSYTRNASKKQLQRLGKDNGKLCKRDEANTRYGTKTEKQITNRSVSISILTGCWWNCIQLYKI